MKIILMILIVVGCKGHHHESLKEKLHKLDQNQIKVNADQISKTRLDGYKYQKSRWKKKKDFHVLERFSHFERKKCEQCHATKNKIPKDASNHKEITIKHAGKETMNCKTCHDSKETWKLHSLGGEKISINHPYKLCSQCHFEQVEDWSKGAHGKRVGGWYGKRVIKNCTDCHNPHAPQFHKQMPKVTPNFLKYKK